jgi:hypothetical protein
MQGSPASILGASNMLLLKLSKNKEFFIIK